MLLYVIISIYLFTSVDPSSETNQHISKISAESVTNMPLPILPCNEDTVLSIKIDKTRFFVHEMQRKAQIEYFVQQIIANFITTLKYEDAWLNALLTHIRNERQLRTGHQCSTDECLFQIPCYLSQRFHGIPYYLQRFPTASKVQIRRRRSADLREFMKTIPLTFPSPNLIYTDELAGQTATDSATSTPTENHNIGLANVKNKPVFENRSDSSQSLFELDADKLLSLNPKNEEILENASKEVIPSFKSEKVKIIYNIKTLKSILKPASSSASYPIELDEDQDTTKIAQVNTDEPDQYNSINDKSEEFEKDEEIEDEDEDSLKYQNQDSPFEGNEITPVTNCSGRFANYCYNSINCIYISVLNSAACLCKPGYTGLRCNLYDLRTTIDTLTQFSSGRFDVERLMPDKSVLVYSVLEATARYTYNSVMRPDV